MFFRIKPLVFSGSKMEEDPNGFIEQTYKVLTIMGVTTVEKEELVANQLKDVTEIWYEQWKDGMLVEAGLIDWLDV